MHMHSFIADVHHQHTAVQHAVPKRLVDMLTRVTLLRVYPGAMLRYLYCTPQTDLIPSWRNKSQLGIFEESVEIDHSSI